MQDSRMVRASIIFENIYLKVCFCILIVHHVNDTLMVLMVMTTLSVTDDFVDRNDNDDSIFRGGC